MDDVKGAIFKFTKNVTSSSGSFIKSTKLSVDLAGQEENLRNVYIEIGKKVHEIYTFGGSLGKFFDEKYVEIEDCERKIKELKDQISAIKGAKTCYSCGKTIDKNAEFCPKCGAKSGSGAIGAEKPGLTEIPEVTDVSKEPFIPHVPEDEIKEVKEEAHDTADSVPICTVKCRSCGAENGVDTKFCLSCGRLL